MTDERPATEQIDDILAGLGDWRGEVLARARALAHAALPDLTEAVKWRKPSNPAGVPVLEHHGILCTLEAYGDKAKITFADGARLDDPTGLFNSSLGGKTRRAIDLREGDELDEAAFTALVRAAAADNAD